MFAYSPLHWCVFSMKLFVDEIFISAWLFWLVLCRWKWHMVNMMNWSCILVPGYTNGHYRQLRLGCNRLFLNLDGLTHCPRMVLPDWKVQNVWSIFNGDVCFQWCQIMKMSLCGSCVLWPHYMSVKWFISTIRWLLCWFQFWRNNRHI
jgi:hypothetical protein